MQKKMNIFYYHIIFSLNLQKNLCDRKPKGAFLQGLAPVWYGRMLERREKTVLFLVKIMNMRKDEYLCKKHLIFLKNDV